MDRTWNGPRGGVPVADRGSDPAVASRPTRLIPFVLACALLADRATVDISTGGHGVLSLLIIVAPLAAVATIARYGKKRSLGFLANPVFLLFVLPYIVLTGLLPVLGVMFNGYPERTLISSTDATTALSFLVLGAALSSTNSISWSRWVFFAIVLELAYAAGQAIYLSKGPGWELFAPFGQWDLSLAIRSGLLSVQGRGSGLYANPNELGLWAGFVAVLAWTVLPPRLKGIGTMLAVVTLLLSQSRGATVALAAALVVGVWLAFLGRRLISRGAAKAILSLGIAGGLAGAAALIVVPASALLERFGAIFSVLTQGPQADPNLAGRVGFWTAVVALNSVYPWGTMGPPELILGTAVDSMWFRTFAQGSVPYVASLALVIVASLFVGESRHRHTLRLLSVVVVVAGVAEDPVKYPVMALFWVVLGAALQSSVASRVAERRARVAPSASGRHGPWRGPVPTYSPRDTPVPSGRTGSTRRPMRTTDSDPGSPGRSATRSSGP